MSTASIQAMTEPRTTRAKPRGRAVWSSFQSTGFAPQGGPPQEPQAELPERSGSGPRSLLRARRAEPRDGPGDQQAPRAELQADHPVHRVEEPPPRPDAQDGDQHARRAAREQPLVDRVAPRAKAGGTSAA